MKAIRTLLGALLISSSTFAYAGGLDSAGGGVLTCVDSSGATSYTLLDLAEAQFSDKLTIVRSSEPLSDQIQNAFEKLFRLNPVFQRQVLAAYHDLISFRKPVPSGQVISPPSDAGIDFIPANCNLVGVAKAKDAEKTLWIQNSVFNKLPPTDQAALWVHEAVYRVLRNTEDVLDSRRARKIVGYLFSSENYPGVYSDRENSKAVCLGHRIQFKQSLEGHIRYSRSSKTGSHIAAARIPRLWIFEPIQVPINDDGDFEITSKHVIRWMVGIDYKFMSAKGSFSWSKMSAQFYHWKEIKSDYPPMTCGLDSDEIEE